MKGEIFRRMSMEINNEEVKSVASVIKDLKKENVEGEDDYLVKTIGAFGLWQGVVSVTVMFTRSIAICNMMSFSFLIPVVEFVCVEFSDNVTIEVNNSTCYDNCLKYQYFSAIGRTIIEEFGLICQNAWLASFTQTLMMLSVLIGVGLFGWISDRFGRRTGLLLSTFINAVFMIALPFSSSYIIFVSVRFVIGIATGGCFLTGFALVMEITGKRLREIAGAAFLIPDGFAQAALAGFAYFTSNWQGYTLSLGIATCLIFVLLLFIPESPRWLVANGKVDEAIKIITHAASRNKLDTSNIRDEITKAVEELKLKEEDVIKTSYLDFFNTKPIFFLTMSVFTLCITLGLFLYGIFQYVTIVGMNLYITVLILGLISIPIFPLAIIINQKFGRKISIIGTTIGMATTMLIIIFVPKGSWLVTLFGSLGFMMSNLSFTIAYIYVSELYPTPMRNMSYGIASGGAKVGSMIAPFVASLSPRWVPSVVFCILSVITGLCCLGLPETKGQNLKDTIEKK